tara:strand:+ start:113 stop:754 length:642 start_codon:yes stop_codon:yes gene_type:complete
MSTIKVDTIKDETGAKTLVTQSGSNFAWGSGLPSGSIVQVQHTQFSNLVYEDSISANTQYVLQGNNGSATSGGGESGILDVNITPKITGSTIWLQCHWAGELYEQQPYNFVFFFWRSVGSTHTALNNSSGTNVGDRGITVPTISHQTDAGTTPEVANWQYFDTHGQSAGQQITYKVGYANDSGGSVTKVYTNRTVATGSETLISSLVAIELAP